MRNCLGTRNCVYMNTQWAWLSLGILKLEILKLNHGDPELTLAQPIQDSRRIWNLQNPDLRWGDKPTILSSLRPTPLPYPILLLSLSVSFYPSPRPPLLTFTLLLPFPPGPTILPFPPLLPLYPTPLPFTLLFSSTPSGGPPPSSPNPWVVDRYVKV